MTKYFLLLFILAGHISTAQNSTPTKPQLPKVFNKSIRQKGKRISTNSNPWVVCNKGSAFYKNDTLKLYNNVNYYYFSNCCDFIDLTFYKKKAFVLVNTKICSEPPTSSVPSLKDWFTVKVVKNKDGLVLETINQGKTITRFKVISIDTVTNVGQKEQATTLLTFVRQNKQR